MSESALDFRLCTMADKSAVLEFMDENWGSKHPLLHREEFFNHYYKLENKDNFQFAVAEESGRILAVIGYIFSNVSQPIDIWVSIWCAQKGKNGIGLELMAKLPELTNCRVMSCNNIRPKTMAFYTFLGYTAARLPHYYRLADKEDYSVARIANKKILPCSTSLFEHGGKACAQSNGKKQGGLKSAYSTKFKLELIKNFDSLNEHFTPCKSLRPFKDLWYIKRRYFNYPLKKYEVYGVLGDACSEDCNKSRTHEKFDNCENSTSLKENVNSQKYKALLITHSVNVSGTNVIRIVDFIGQSFIFEALGESIDGLIKEKNAEYADCYCYGIGEETFAKIGFCARSEQDENIIPNYLTPPLYENTEFYFFTTDSENFTMFKADGDGDRPNVT